MRKGRARGGPGLRDDRQRLAVVLEQAGALGGGHQRENPAGPAHVLPACGGLGDSDTCEEMEEEGCIYAMFG